MQLCKQQLPGYPFGDGAFCNHPSNGNGFCVSVRCFSRDAHACHTGDRNHLGTNILQGDFSENAFDYAPGNVFGYVSRVYNVDGSIRDDAFLPYSELSHAVCDAACPSHWQVILQRLKITLPT